ncbi:MAG: 30S ribosomal protein S24e [Methanobacteriota archaeon]|nr:MAG: 30S ribosomal protein S24e [Euryarchaeota archaeon]
MEVNILEEKKNPLLDRLEIIAELSFPNEATPSREAVISRMSALLNTDKDRFVLREIKTRFGENKAIAYARIYDSPEIAMKLEHQYILKRNKLIGEDGNE